MSTKILSLAELNVQVEELQKQVAQLWALHAEFLPKPQPENAVQQEVDKILEEVGRQRAIVGVPPVDRTQTQLVSGAPVSEDHRQLKENGQQKDYVVLTPEERAKGFVRPVRRSYVHKTCGGLTTMGLALAETYARDPQFYSGTFCCGCGKHFPVAEFTWDGTNEQVGS